MQYHSYINCEKSLKECMFFIIASIRLTVKKIDQNNFFALSIC